LKTSSTGSVAEDPRAEVRKELGAGKNRRKLPNLANARCRKMALGFLFTAGGKTQEDRSSPGCGESQSEVSERDLTHRTEKDEEQGREAEELGAEVEE